jgi:superfamily II DNA/RNA helicase
VSHRMEPVKGGKDKLELLRDVLARHHAKGQRTLVFCNTVASCRAVEYALNQVLYVRNTIAIPACSSTACF